MTVEATPPLPRLRPSRWPQLATAVLLIAAVGAIYWRATQAASPAAVVQRCGEALKAGNWKAVYSLIAWDDASQRMDEGTFVTFAGIYGKVYRLQDFAVGTPTVTGDRATVPITASVRITELLTSETRSGPGTVKCRRVRGEWLLEPDLSNGFLGLNPAAAKSASSGAR